MGYGCRVLADSFSPLGIRLTSLEVTMPRIVLAEFNTHRMLSRNSASSRAIPVEKRIAAVLADPFVPELFGKNPRGMQAGEELGAAAARQARKHWLLASQEACDHARKLAELEVHKQLANRLIEPFCWHTVIVSATEWSNFFALRCHPAAQPEIRRAAELMRDALAVSTPLAVNYRDWHLPLLEPGEAHDLAVGGKHDPRKVSVGRCARVSYLTHDGRRDPAEDEALCDRLADAGHMSPFEHAATPVTYDERGFLYGVEDNPVPFVGNFRGWTQFRKQIPSEADFGARVPR